MSNVTCDQSKYGKESAYENTKIYPYGITPILGLLGGFAGAIFVILLSVISLLIRIYKKKKA